MTRKSWGAQEGGGTWPAAYSSSSSRQERGTSWLPPIGSDSAKSVPEMYLVALSACACRWAAAVDVYGAPAAWHSRGARVGGISRDLS